MRLETKHMEIEKIAEHVIVSVIWKYKRETGIFRLGGGGGGVWEVKAQTSRRVREHVPSGKFEKTWIALNCISCIFKVEK